jgi:hypothetical protein
MSNPGDKRSQQPGSKEADLSAQDAPADSKRSGRIAYDERGNSVWEWQLETGVYSRDISTQRLKKLDLNDLSIADTAIGQRPPGLDPARGRLPGGGFNPYDNSTSTRGNVGNNPYSGGARAPLKPAPEPKRKPTDRKKLQEWMELRKRVEQNKREDEE